MYPAQLLSERVNRQKHRDEGHIPIQRQPFQRPNLRAHFLFNGSQHCRLPPNTSCRCRADDVITEVHPRRDKTGEVGNVLQGVGLVSIELPCEADGVEG